MSALTDLRVPLIQAPMAGGPSTPELAAAVTNAGGLGSIAGGYLSAESFDELITRTGALTDTLNVNVFVPEAHRPQSEVVRAYGKALAQHLNTDEPAIPPFNDDAFDAKIGILEQHAPAVVTFSFGCPEPDAVELIAQAGSLIGITVTIPEEARSAQDAGADFLIAQCYKAGGHLSVHDQSGPAPQIELTDLIRSIAQTVDLPVVGAGGIGTVAQAQQALDAGATAVSLGTRFLTCDEAGTKPVHKAALTSGEFKSTVQTRAFSGRLARGLSNQFIDTMDPYAVVGYPYVHYMTSPWRKAHSGDPQNLNLWAGTEFTHCEHQPAADIVREFAALSRR